jgi:serine O-acetyltransferase
MAQLAEDFRTHDRNPAEPGFWAVAIHRYGRWTQRVEGRAARTPLRLVYRALFRTSDWLWGIYLPDTVELGRRVRIWHHGCMWLTAKSIGDDVHIRQNTTLGPLIGRDADATTQGEWPIIEDRVQLGSGACVLGNVIVGRDSTVGANTVVLRSFPPGSRVLGVPARPIPA